jgi:uncharacterized membrane protein (TIGR02234 family)
VTVVSRSAGTAQPRWRRKSFLILVALAAALVVFGSTTQTWVQVHLAQGAVQQSDIAVPGSKAATAVTALALVALAGALAASIAGRVARLLAAVLILLSAAGILAAAISVLADAQGAAAGPVATATGVTGGTYRASTTAFPTVAVVGAVVLAAAAVLIAVAGRTWSQRTKYDSARTTLPSGHAASGNGADAEPDADATGNSTAEASTADAAPLDDIDSWDQLSRGTDPTG